MSDTDSHPFKDLEDKENERRRAIGLPPLAPEVWRPQLAKKPLPVPVERDKRKGFADYSMTDVEENIREHRELKRKKYSGERLERYMESYKIGLMRRVEAAILEKGGKLETSDSLVVADKSTIKTIPIQNKGELENSESESFVIADKNGIKFVPVREVASQAGADMEPQGDAQEVKSESTRDRLRGLQRSIFSTAFPTLSRIADKLESGKDDGTTFRQRLETLQRDVFKTAFPTLAKVVDTLERKKREDSKERSREAIRDRRTLDRTESMAAALESLSREQEKSVDLLRELLDAVKGLRGGGGSNRLGFRLPRGLGRAARLAGRAAPYAIGAAVVGLGAYALMNRIGAGTSEQPVPEDPINQAEPSQQGRDRDQGPIPIDVSELFYTENGRFYINNTEVSEEVYNNFRTLAEQDTAGMDPAQLEERNGQILGVLSDVQSGRAAPVTQEQQAVPNTTQEQTTIEPIDRSESARSSTAAQYRAQAEQEVDRALQRSNYTPTQSDDYEQFRERLINHVITDRDVGIDPARRDPTDNTNAISGVSDEQIRNIRLQNIIQQHRINRTEQSSEAAYPRQTRTGMTPAAIDSSEPIEISRLTAPDIQPVQAQDQQAIDPNTVIEPASGPNSLVRPVSYMTDRAQPLSKEPVVKVESSDVLSNRKTPIEPDIGEPTIRRLIDDEKINQQIDPTAFMGTDLLLKAKKVTFKGDEIEFISGDLATNKRDFGGLLTKTPDATTGAGKVGASTPGASQVPSEGGGAQTIGTDSQSTDTSNISFAPGVDPRIKKEIAQKVQQIEGVFGKKLLVTSGFRDQARNAAAGGARNSAHTRANAVDIQFSGNEQDTIKVIEAASAAGIGGIGVYRPGWLHLDTESKRVWGPDFSARSVPTWAKPALEAHMSGKSQQDAQAVAAEEPTPSTAVGSDATPSENNVGGEGSGSAQLLSETGDTAAVGAASAESSMPTNGLQVATASQENAMAERTPVAPNVIIPETQTVGRGSPGLSAPSIFNSPDDPGPVEPADAAERYAKLFNMAA